MATDAVTLGEIYTQTGISPALAAQIEIPVLLGAQRQGDVAWAPRPTITPATTPVPREGICLVRGDVGGNAHMLHSWDGACFFDPALGGSNELGVLTVPPGATAFVVHTGRHGANGLGPGVYKFWSQLEFAGEWRRVAD